MRAIKRCDPLASRSIAKLFWKKQQTLLSNNQGMHNIARSGEGPRLKQATSRILLALVGGEIEVLGESCTRVYHESGCLCTPLLLGQHGRWPRVPLDT